MAAQHSVMSEQLRYVSFDIRQMSVTLVPLGDHTEGGPLSVPYLHTDASSGDEPCQTARELVFLAGPDDDWLLPEDGVLDLSAVAVAVDGARRVRLTLTERVTAAYRILASGGTVHNVCLRLGLPEDTERKWQQLQACMTSALAVILVAAVALSQIVQLATPSLRGNHDQLLPASQLPPAIETRWPGHRQFLL